MFNLLRADFYKLRKSKAFLFTAVACLGIGAIHMLIPDAPADLMGIDSGLGALEMLATNFHAQIFVAFVVVFITAEFHLGTIKNTISRGTGRMKLYLSKFIVTSVATLLLLFVYTLVHVVFGTMRWGFSPYEGIPVYQIVNLIGWHMLFVTAYTALFMLISIAFRNLAGAMVASYLYLITVALLLPADGALVRYELQWNVRNFGTLELAYENHWHGIVVALAWLVVSLALGVVIFRRQDIK